MRILRSIFVIVLGLCSLALGGSVPSLSEPEKSLQWPGLQAEGWSVTGPAAVRLISARDRFSPNAAATLGVQIKLRPGWWTYWRAPGDMGMPPDFDWSGSRNLKWPPELFWPKPMQKTSFGHALRIYRDEVVFPLRVVAADPDKPIQLKLDLTFGVCKEVCIPNRVQIAFDLAPQRGADPQPVPLHMALIRRFEAEVPNANVQRAGLRIQNVGLLRDASGGDILAVEIGKADAQAQPIVLIELSPGEAPLIAKSLGRDTPSSTWRFAADLDGPQSRDTVAGRRVRVTIFDRGKSLEQIWVVGASADSSGRFGRATAGGQTTSPLKSPEESWKPRD